MDRGSAVSTTLPPRPVGIGTTTYAKDVARVVQPGAVAKRITQLQAALLHQDPASSSTRSSLEPVARPAVKGQIERERLQSSLSPSNVPLPQTPSIATHAGTQNRQHYGASNLVTSKAKDRSTRSIPQNQISESTANPFSSGPEPKPTESSTLFQQQAAEKFIDTEEPAEKPILSAYVDTPFHPLRPKASILSPLFVAQLQDSPTHLRSSPDPIKRSPSPSPGGAYSKISPFVSNTSIPSYIPIRQSPKNGAGDEVLLRKFKSMHFDGQGRLSPNSTLPHTPRSRDMRSLRRRILSVAPGSNNKATTSFEGSHQSAATSSAGSLEDVFTDSARMDNLHYAESVSGSNDDQSMNSSMLHDERHSVYAPDNISGFDGCQGVWTEARAQLAIPATTGLSWEPEFSSHHNAGTVQRLHRIERPGNDSFLDSRYPRPSTSPISSQKGTFPTHQRNKSPEASQNMAHTRGLQEDLSHTDYATMPTLDGVQHSTRHRTFSHQNTASSSTGVLQPVSPTISFISYPSDVLHNRRSLANQINQENGLKLIITVDRDVKKAVKIEVHPLVDVCPSAAEYIERNSVIG